MKAMKTLSYFNTTCKTIYGTYKPKNTTLSIPKKNFIFENYINLKPINVQAINQVNSGNHELINMDLSFVYMPEIPEKNTFKKTLVENKDYKISVLNYIEEKNYDKIINIGASAAKNEVVADCLGMSYQTLVEWFSSLYKASLNSDCFIQMENHNGDVLGGLLCINPIHGKKYVEEWKQINSTGFDIDRYSDLFSKIELPEEYLHYGESINTAFLFVNPKIHSKGIGKTIWKEGMEYLKQKGYKYATGEPINKWIANFYAKNTDYETKFYNHMNYSDYSYNGKKLSFSNKNNENEVICSDVVLFDKPKF